MRQFLAKEWQDEETNPLMTVTGKAKLYPDIIDFSIGDPDLPVPAEILEKAGADARAGYTKYSDPWGYPELRDAIVRFYAEDYGEMCIRDRPVSPPAPQAENAFVR